MPDESVCRKRLTTGLDILWLLKPSGNPLHRLPALLLHNSSRLVNHGEDGEQMTNQGTVTVIVLDPTGATIQGAKLQLQDLATNEMREAETQQVGSHTFVALSAGTFKLTVSKNGFQTEVLDSVVVQSNRVTDVKVSLKVGAALEKIVVAESSIPLLETTSSAIAATIIVSGRRRLVLCRTSGSALEAAFRSQNPRAGRRQNKSC